MESIFVWKIKRRIVPSHAKDLSIYLCLLLFVFFSLGSGSCHCRSCTYVYIMANFAHLKTGSPSQIYHLNICWRASMCVEVMEKKLLYWSTEEHSLQDIQYKNTLYTPFLSMNPSFSSYFYMKMYSG